MKEILLMLIIITHLIICDILHLPASVVDYLRRLYYIYRTHRRLFP
jgi:hypothetical protein